MQTSPETLAFLETRFSRPAKTFTGPVPSRTALREILTRAIRVPDHGKLEPWRMVVLEAADFIRLADLAEARAVELGGDAEKISKGRGQFDRGLLAVAVISSPKPSEKIPEAEQYLSAGALCLSIVLNAQASGWGANWLSGWASHDPVFCAKAFGLTPTEKIAGIIHIATPSANGADRPRPVLDAVLDWGLPVQQDQA